jgi:hypothetical protein
MIQKTVNILTNAVSKGRLDAAVRLLSNYERYHASPDFRAAAGWCRDYLKSEGIEAEIHSYPADIDIKYQTDFAPQTWDCRGAWCELVDIL